MATLGDSTQSHGHFLHVVRHWNQDQQKPDKVEAILGTGGRVGCDAPSIVVCHHHDQAWTSNDEIKPNSFPIFAQCVVEPGKQIHFELSSKKRPELQVSPKYRPG